jgi:hypothetical protein
VACKIQASTLVWWPFSNGTGDCHMRVTESCL